MARTRLTGRPGEPTAAERTDPPAELYVAGFGLPQEPRVPGRFRRLIIVTVSTVVVAGGAYLAFRITTAGESFDPLVDQPDLPVPAVSATP